MGLTENVQLQPDVRSALEARVTSAEVGAVFLLPARIEGAAGLYRESQFAVPKELRAAGIPIEFLHPAEERRALGEFSAELVGGFALGVAQNMTWDAAKLIWQYVRAKAAALTQPDQPATVSVEVARVAMDGRVIEGLRVTGLADDETAVALLRALTGEPSTEPPA